MGDVHGCLRPLRKLIDKISPTEADRIVFLGDYIDRGPDSKGVIEYLLDFQKKFPQAVFLKGNHEEMFLNFLSGQDQSIFLYNGGASTIESYQESGGIRIPKEHLQFFQELKLSYETEDYIFVHAGLRPYIPVNRQRTEDLLWIREDFLQSDYDWGKTVVYGHTPRREPLLEEKRICVDTGAVYGHSLSCCDVKRRTCWMA